MKTNFLDVVKTAISRGSALMEEVVEEEGAEGALGMFTQFEKRFFSKLIFFLSVTHLK